MGIRSLLAGWVDGVKVVDGIESNTLIQRRSEEVWGLISDLTTLKEWDPGVIEVRWQRPIGVGGTFTIIAEFLGRQREAPAVITEYEPDRRIGWRIFQEGTWVTWGKTALDAVYSIEPVDGDKARLSRVLSATVQGLLGRALVPILARQARRDRFAEITSIKRIVERLPQN
jgi:Polyketide cyclase / dehydrase and lipid transport